MKTPTGHSSPGPAMPQINSNNAPPSLTRTTTFNSSTSPLPRFDSYASNPNQNHNHPPQNGLPNSSNHIPIPSAIPPIKTQLDSTPLPTLPIVVLCFAMISEFLSASVSGPFIFFMIEDFGVGAGEQGGGEAAVGFWAGIVSSAFFLTQFLTSILWSNVSNTHGRRIVLFSSLLGNALTLLLFGTSTSLGMAICARLGQGVFNGAIGVARGAVRDVTDSTNEGRAIAWIGLCWGMGGITGPIIGGLLEHPAENYPALFGRFQLLKDYPYILPCFVASCITFTGAILSLFLGWDGGYRTGKIQLVDSIKQLELPNQSGPYDQTADRVDVNGTINLQPSSRDQVLVRNPLAITRTSTAATAPRSEANNRQSGFTPGSAYGYDQGMRRAINWRGHADGMGSLRSVSRTMNRRSSRAFSLARSFGGDTNYAPDYDHLGNLQSSPPTLNFAQRLLLANEDAVFGLHDVWLAAATSQDRDDEYSQLDIDEQDGWGDSVFEDDDSRIEDDGFGYDDGASDIGSFDHRGRAFIQQQMSKQAKQRLQSQSSARPSDVGMGRRPESVVKHRLGSRLSPRGSFSNQSNLPSSVRYQNRIPFSGRSTSIASSARPAIFDNTGLSTPPPVGARPFLLNQFNQPHSPRDRLNAPADLAGSSNLVLPDSVATNANLSVIPEGTGRANDVKGARIGGPGELEGDGKSVSEIKQESVFKQLPLAIIAQYAVVALHGTTCDQVFMSFLVTPIKSGGLGLSAGHYAELIAAMCIAQIVYQFRFYPTVGPPRGTLSHLSMFRLGLLLYIPVYMLLPELRGLLRENQNGLVMIGMIMLSSFRWLANVCAYTAVMVMINAQTPPHLVPLANGLAQSAVSAARFVGPVFGGMIWSFSITPSPDAKPYPFNNALGFFVITLICLTG
ncbi:hypothetical protein PPACK8108_LOCUS7192 [Phakopsora pachyrhizi]|uniref:Major facilitator superfamily (MFS) profile domain-containing protein n=1 Tax=Phakopsora pachyrhizi TaxID=170000 RepID=A0AAV0ASH1_PHAPC|nr:hypothetical protein PPACK8108_LOCUS7192 [Phakopsora pachyrhizi]